MGIIDDMHRKKREEKAAWQRDQRDIEAAHERLMQRFDKEVLPHIRRALPSEYNAWITGFIANSGQPTHCYDYPMSNQSFYIAISDFELLALAGSTSINVIVPKGIKVKSDDLGHCNLYFMDDFTCRGGFVPVFEDTEETS